MEWAGNCVYLHFLDRELRRSVSAHWSSDQAFAAILASLCLSPGDLACSYSHLWESEDLLEPGRTLLLDLVRIGILRPASNYPTADEFLESRLALYRHDAVRYPFYFSDSAHSIIGGVHPASLTTRSATDSLSVALWNVATGRDRPDWSKREGVSELISRVLDKRGAQAVTGSLFEPALGQGRFLVRLIKREISSEYTRHYMRETGGTILTGLPQLSAYDRLASHAFSFDYYLVRTLMRCSGTDMRDLRGILEGVEAAAQSCQSPEAAAFRSLWWEFICRGTSIYPESDLAYAEGTRSWYVSQIRRHALPREPGPPSFERMSDLLSSILSRLHSPREISSKPTILLAFIVATDVEWSEFRNELGRRGGVLEGLDVQRVPAWSVRGGGFDGCVIIRTEMGSRSPSSAQFVVADAIRDVCPMYLLMLGIAFGLKEDKSALGDILVATSVTDYEPARIGVDETVQRGPTYLPDTQMLAKARVVAEARSNVHFGEVLSGEKLVDEPRFREILKKMFPNAIGGEMESAGLASACHRYQARWLLAKAICDWGQNKSQDHQVDAAKGSVRFGLDLARRLIAT